LRESLSRHNASIHSQQNKDTFPNSDYNYQWYQSIPRAFGKFNISLTWFDGFTIDCRPRPGKGQPQLSNGLIFCDIGRLVAEYWEKSLVAQLEQLGESEVRVRFARGNYGLTGGLKYRVVKDWLDSKESARKSAREVRKIELPEDANPIAHKA
jgi:hypothetical protein